MTSKLSIGDFVVVSKKIDVQNSEKFSYQGYVDDSTRETIREKILDGILQITALGTIGTRESTNKWECAYRVRGMSYSQKVWISEEFLTNVNNRIRIPLDTEYGIGSYVKLNIDFINTCTKRKGFSWADPFHDINQFYVTIGLKKKTFVAKDIVAYDALIKKCKYELANSEFIITKVYRRKNSKIPYYKLSIPDERRRTSFLWAAFKKSSLPVLPGSCFYSDRLIPAVRNSKHINELCYYTAAHTTAPGKMVIISAVESQQGWDYEEVVDKNGLRKDKKTRTSNIKYTIIQTKHLNIEGGRYSYLRGINGDDLTVLQKGKYYNRQISFGNMVRGKQGKDKYADHIKTLKYYQWLLEPALVEIESEMQDPNGFTIPLDNALVPDLKSLKDNINNAAKSHINNTLNHWLKGIEQAHGSNIDFATPFYYLFYRRINKIMEEQAKSSVNIHNSKYGDYARIVLRDKK